PGPRPWKPPPLDTTPFSARTHRSHPHLPPQENSPFPPETKPSSPDPGALSDQLLFRDATLEPRAPAQALNNKARPPFPARRKTAASETRTASEGQGARRGVPRSEERTRERSTDHKKTG